MKKFKKKFLLTGLALAVPLVGAIASACSEVSQDQQPQQPGKQDQQPQQPGKQTNSSSSNIGSLENLPMFIKLAK